MVAWLVWKGIRVLYNQKRKVLTLAVSGIICIVLYSLLLPRDFTIKVPNHVLLPHHNDFPERPTESIRKQFEETTKLEIFAQPNIIIYNRLPKCASTMMRILIYRTAASNNASFVNELWPNIKQFLDKDEQVITAKRVTEFQDHTIYLRHLYFMDFNKIGNAQLNITYINIIRDPVERFISRYYFLRFGMKGWSERKIQKWLGIMPSKKRYMSLEDCVLRNATQCVLDHKDTMIEYFCGMDKRCRSHDSWSVQKAKQNILKYYSFIGLTERLQESLVKLESLFPSYFSGISNEYNSNKNAFKTQTAHKRDPGESIKNILTKYLKHEIEIYNFVKSTFWSE